MENECTACPSNAWADKVSCYISEKLDRFTKPNYFLPVSNFLFFTIPILDRLFVLPNSFSSRIERSLWPKLYAPKLSLIFSHFFGNITTSVFRFRSFRCFGFSDGAHQTVEEKNSLSSKNYFSFWKKETFWGNTFWGNCWWLPQFSQTARVVLVKRLEWLPLDLKVTASIPLALDLLPRTWCSKYRCVSALWCQSSKRI